VHGLIQHQDQHWRDHTVAKDHSLQVAQNRVLRFLLSQQDSLAFIPELEQLLDGRWRIDPADQRMVDHLAANAASARPARSTPAATAETANRQLGRARPSERHR
jgi:hypothetical protein